MDQATRLPAVCEENVTVEERLSKPLRVVLWERGEAVADVRVQEWVRNHFAAHVDIETSNVTVIDAVRVYLKQLPINERPKVEWEFYGKKVTFDDDLRSDNAWDDPRTQPWLNSLSLL